MDIGSIFLILGLLVMVGLFISRPFFEHKHFRREPGRSRTIVPPGRKRPPAEYACKSWISITPWEKSPRRITPPSGLCWCSRERKSCAALDAYQAEAPAQGCRSAPGGSHRRPARGNRASTCRRKWRGDPRWWLHLRTITWKRLIANRRRARSEKSSGFCPQCGKPIQKSDRFCPKCGAPAV